ncbi:MAG TPA: MFS transporter, partial [Rubrivivax sp.]|nr:MFS transporter [Rubrivivax sp.]
QQYEAILAFYAEDLVGEGGRGKADFATFLQEAIAGGMLSGLRFVRHSEAVLAQLVRTVAYSAAGSALWALLPVIAQRQLGLGAAGFGFLIGCLGAGAVLTGF